MGSGCGVCCALETCPAARLLFRQAAGPCPALAWSADERRYRCGLLTAPTHYLRWLPAVAVPLFAPLARRYLAIGAGCDSDTSAEPETTS